MAFIQDRLWNHPISLALTLPSVLFVCICVCICLCIAIIVHQESVCATFGSGLSSACVVDVGDQKTSLCCVEDGVSHRNSRCDFYV